jgi:hypothetical protein
MAVDIDTSKGFRAGRPRQPTGSKEPELILLGVKTYACGTGRHTPPVPWKATTGVPLGVELPKMAPASGTGRFVGWAAGINTGLASW